MWRALLPATLGRSRIAISEHFFWRTLIVDKLLALQFGFESVGIDRAVTVQRFTGNEPAAAVHAEG